MAIYLPNDVTIRRPNQLVVRDWMALSTFKNVDPDTRRRMKRTSRFTNVRS